MRTIDDVMVTGRRVLVRADLNVPLDGSRITDDGRIRACLPTLKALLARGAAVVVCAHLGRPAGAPDPAYSLEPVASCTPRCSGGQSTRLISPWRPVTGDWISVHRSWRLNGRHYGALQGRDKAQAVAEFGAERVQLWRSFRAPLTPQAVTGFCRVRPAKPHTAGPTRDNDRRSTRG